MQKHTDIGLPDNESYRFWKLYDDTIIIQYGEGLYSFLLLGKTKALLIDTAFGRGEFFDLVQELKGEKTLCVVNTHGHFDHTGGNAWFPEVYMHPNAVSYAKHPFSPYDEAWLESLPYPDYKILPVEDGHVFELGDRMVEVLYTPAHSDSSLSFIDHKRRLLFSGDEFDSGQANLSDLASVRSFLRNMLRLQSRKADFDWICPSHNGCPIAKEYIEEFIVAAQHIVDGKPDTVPFEALPGYKQPHHKNKNSLRAQVGLACINYRHE